jgi:predicted membrane protein
MNHWFDHAWARGVSLAAAVTLMLLVTLLPRGLTHGDDNTVSHGVLALVMWGLSAGFVHGVGFIPHSRVLRSVLGPFVAWLGMGVAVIFYIRYFLR